jgi:hypothetical protein
MLPNIVYLHRQTSSKHPQNMELMPMQDPEARFTRARIVSAILIALVGFALYAAAIAHLIITAPRKEVFEAMF